MRSRNRIATIVLLGLSCLFALGLLTPGAGAMSTMAKVKVGLTKENVHLLDVAIRSYAEEHGGLYPRFTTSREFRALLRPYLFTGPAWPTNPYTDRPVRFKRSAGNVTYATYGHLTCFRLIGWGQHGHRIMVVKDLDRL